MIVIVLISSMCQLSSGTNESSGRSRRYLSSFIDHGIKLPKPELGPALGGPNGASVGEEALFATHSFNESGTTYNVELYYRQPSWRIRAKVLIGDRELRGLLNRFYREELNHQMSIFVTREDGIPDMTFSFGFLLLKELSVNTDAVYDATEEFVRKNLPEWRNLRISVDPPPGLLKRTCIASLKDFYLVNDAGQVDPFTLENLRVAYNREGIKAENPSDLERIGRSLIKADRRHRVRLEAVLISDVNEIPGYDRSPLDPANEEKITAPRFFSDGRTTYWRCYTYKRFAGVVSQYTFGASEGQLTVAEPLILGRKIGNAEFALGAPMPLSRQDSTRRTTNALTEKKKSIEIPPKAPAVKRITLLEAAKNGDIDQAKQLITSGADVNTKQKFGYTPLHCAAWDGHKNIAEFLLARGADVNAATWLGDTPLHSAAERNHHDIAALLIHAGSNVNDKGCYGRTPLHHAARLGNKAIAQMLLANGAAVNVMDEGGYSPLYGAAQAGHTEVVALLISKGANLESKNPAGRKTLYRAAEEGHKDVVNLLISRGADVNAVTNDGETALHVAAEQGHAEVIELLIEKGANVNAMKKPGYSTLTPLHKAAWYGHLKVAQILISNGADVNSKNNSGETPLSQAISSGSTETVELLIANGADVNAKKYNHTVLHEAAEDGYIEMVKLLVEKGADINAKNNRGKTPLDLARDKKRQDVVQFLLSRL